MSENADGAESHGSGAILLIVFSLVSAGIGYASSILVARILGHEGFHDYAVAISSLALLSTFAEAGTGKFALRILPVYVGSGQWSRAAGFMRFSLRSVLLISVVLAVVVALVEGLEDKQFGDYPLGIAVLFLPAAALAGTAVDFVMANQAAIRGALIARVVIPVTTLILILATASLVDGFNASWAVGCYGSGALIGAILAVWVFARSSRREVFSAVPCYETKTWMGECLSFLILAMLMTWIFKISVIVLATLPIAEIEVALFAAAMETGCLILLLSKSTDKYFQPYISLMIEHESWEDAAKMRRRRWIWIGAACAAFLFVIFVFGKSILRLYGEPFVDGHPALCLVAMATTTWTLFSLAPSYLKYIGFDRIVFSMLVGGAIAMAALTAILGYRWGATGAGAAFCIVLASVALVLMMYANRHLNRARETLE
jgi:O-antigen/teichoic acid export membrane protein